MPFDDSELEPEKEHAENKQGAVLIQSAFRSSRVRKTISNLHSIIAQSPPEFCIGNETLKYLGMGPNDRSEEQLEAMLEQFMEIGFFAELPPLQQLQCCQSLGILRIKAGQVLYEQGDPGDNFYVAVRGGMAVTGGEGGGQVELPLGVGDSFGEHEMTRFRETNQEDIDSTNAVAEDVSDGKRTTRVHARVDSVLATVSRANYLKITGALEDAVVGILKKDPDDRTAADVAVVLAYMEAVPFFRALHYRTLQNVCCRFMSYRKQEAEEHLFKIDEVGSEFFVLLNGTVRVLIRGGDRRGKAAGYNRSGDGLLKAAPMLGAGPTQKGKRNKANTAGAAGNKQRSGGGKKLKRSGSKKKLGLEPETEPEAEAEPETEYRVDDAGPEPEPEPEPEFEEKKPEIILRAGAGFGEIALTSDDPRDWTRSAGIQCHSDGPCHFAVLGRDHYLDATAKIEGRVMHALETPSQSRTVKQLELLMEFFRNERFFKKLALEGLRKQACTMLFRQNVKASGVPGGKVLWHEGDENPDTFHIIVRGGPIREEIAGVEVRKLHVGDELGSDALLPPQKMNLAKPTKNLTIGIQKAARVSTMIADADVVLATVLREDYERIFKVDEVMDWIQQFWNLVCLESLGHAADENNGDKVTFSAYCELHKRISKTIQEDFDAEEEKDIVVEDWEEDLARAHAADEFDEDMNFLRMHEFKDALFQLVDVWCEHVDSMELFVQFLEMLFENMAELDRKTQSWRYKNMSKISSRCDDLERIRDIELIHFEESEKQRMEARNEAQKKAIQPARNWKKVRQLAGSMIGAFGHGSVEAAAQYGGSQVAVTAKEIADVGRSKVRAAMKMGLFQKMAAMEFRPPPEWSHLGLCVDATVWLQRETKPPDPVDHAALESMGKNQLLTTIVEAELGVDVNNDGHGLSLKMAVKTVAGKGGNFSQRTAEVLLREELEGLTKPALRERALAAMRKQHPQPSTVTEWVQGKIISLNEPGQVSDIGGGAGGAAGQAVDKAGRRKTKSESDDKGKGPFVVVLLPPKAAAAVGGGGGDTDSGLDMFSSRGTGTTEGEQAMQEEVRVPVAAATLKLVGHLVEYDLGKGKWAAHTPAVSSVILNGIMSEGIESVMISEGGTTYEVLTPSLQPDQPLEARTVVNPVGASVEQKGWEGSQVYYGGLIKHAGEHSGGYKAEREKVKKRVRRRRREATEKKAWHPDEIKKKSQETWDYELRVITRIQAFWRGFVARQFLKANAAMRSMQDIQSELDAKLDDMARVAGLNKDGSAHANAASEAASPNTRTRRAKEQEQEQARRKKAQNKPAASSFVAVTKIRVTRVPPIEIPVQPSPEELRAAADQKRQRDKQERLALGKRGFGKLRRSVLNKVHNDRAASEEANGGHVEKHWYQIFKPDDSDDPSSTSGQDDEVQTNPREFQKLLGLLSTVRRRLESDPRFPGLIADETMHLRRTVKCQSMYTLPVAPKEYSLLEARAHHRSISQSRKLWPLYDLVSQKEAVARQLAAHIGLLRDLWNPVDKSVAATKSSSSSSQGGGGGRASMFAPLKAPPQHPELPLSQSMARLMDGQRPLQASRGWQRPPQGGRTKVSRGGTVRRVTRSRISPYRIEHAASGIGGSIVRPVVASPKRRTRLQRNGFEDEAAAALTTVSSLHSEAAAWGNAPRSPQLFGGPKAAQNREGSETVGQSVSLPQLIPPSSSHGAAIHGQSSSDMLTAADSKSSLWSPEVSSWEEQDTDAQKQRHKKKKNKKPAKSQVTGEDTQYLYGKHGIVATASLGDLPPANSSAGAADPPSRRRPSDAGTRPWSGNSANSTNTTTIPMPTSWGSMVST